MKSSLILVNAAQLPMTVQPPGWPSDKPFVPRKRPGFIMITDPSLPIPPNLPGTPEGVTFPVHVMHMQPELAVPTDIWTLVIVNGVETPWTAEELIAAWPNGSKYVLNAEYPNPAFVPGCPPMTRPTLTCKVIQVPDGVTPTKTNITPHQWLGDN